MATASNRFLNFFFHVLFIHDTEEHSRMIDSRCDRQKHTTTTEHADTPGPWVTATARPADHNRVYVMPFSNT